MQGEPIFAQPQPLRLLRLPLRDVQPGQLFGSRPNDVHPKHILRSNDKQHNYSPNAGRVPFVQPYNVNYNQLLGMQTNDTHASGHWMMQNSYQDA